MRKELGTKITIVKHLNCYKETCTKNKSVSFFVFLHSPFLESLQLFLLLLLVYLPSLIHLYVFVWGNIHNGNGQKQM